MRPASAMATGRYLVRCSGAFLFKRSTQCPNCGGISSHLVSRKYLVTELRRCAQCALMFRLPADSIEESLTFYNDGSYRQDFTTDLPDDAMLDRLMAANFRGSPKDYKVYIAMLDALGLRPGDSLFDFGCSWGYGVYQLRRRGFRVTAHEISAARRAYAADRLGIEFIEDLDALEPEHPLFESFDCFFSAHVLEHVPCPRQIFEWAGKLLRPGGLFVSFTPNGSKAHRRRNQQWNKLWGQVHPNLIDDRFLRRSFVEWPRLLTSAPYICEAVERPRSGETLLGSLDGSELMFAAVKAGQHPARGVNI
jgi:2-polyprenyl-3-methyl-5-hydroxy-6-metoxy-1,4-benzoquinol methylase